MKPDKELLRIWEEYEDRDNSKAQNNYSNLSIEEKARLFDLIIKEKHKAK